MILAPGELLVGRGWRWDADKIEADIEIDRREKVAQGAADPEPSVSVFAVPHDGGEFSDTLERLKATFLRSRRARWLAVVTQSELAKPGFRLELSEPPPDHHDLILGKVTDDGSIVCLERVFNARERVKLQ